MRHSQKAELNAWELKVIFLGNTLHCKLRSPTVKAMSTTIIKFSYSQLQTTYNYFLYEFYHDMHIQNNRI